MTIHFITILPTDPPAVIKRITKPIATHTQWWYILPSETKPRPIVRFGRMWKCVIPSVRGMELNMDEDFHTLIEDLRLSGATIYNKPIKR